MSSVRNDERYRRESACVFVKGAGQSGVQSEMVVVYFESINREVEIKPVYECRCDERLKTKAEEFTRLTYTRWDHIVLETTPERFVFRPQTGPLFSSESSKMQLCRHRGKTETVIGTVSVRVFDVCVTNFIYPMNHVCEDIVFA